MFFIFISFFFTITEDVPEQLIGDQRTVTITIIKNDNANGILQFSSSRVEVEEGAGESRKFINVTRHAGTFGDVRNCLFLNGRSKMTSPGSEIVILQ